MNLNIYLKHPNEGRSPAAGLECGRLVATGRGLATNLDPTSLDPTSLVPTGRGLARAKRQLNIRLTPFCSTSACLAQRAVGAGLLGAAGALA